jgi:hypothetical protein
MDNSGGLAINLVWALTSLVAFAAVSLFVMLTSLPPKR